MATKNPLLKKIGLALLTYAVLEGLKIAIAEQHELSQHTKEDHLVQKIPFGFDSPIVKQRFASEYEGAEVYSTTSQSGVSPNMHLGSMTGDFAQLQDGSNIIQIKDNQGQKQWRLASSIKTI